MPKETYLRPEEIRTVAVIGTGSVGASWAALFLAHDIAVVAHDPSPNAEAVARSFIADAWPALVELGVANAPVPPLQKLSFVDSPAAAARVADLVQENIPEKPELKAKVLAEIDAASPPDKIILSSTGGIPPSQLQASCEHPERFVVVHPFNPSHLIPLVEVVGGRETAPEVVEWAIDFSRYVGKQPIRLNVEASGHMTNRLQFALVREAVHCFLEGIASAKDIDAAVKYGLGPRWTLMGSLLTLHLAGGPGGMKGILDHAGKAIEEWWTPLGQPKLTAEVKARLVAAGNEVSDGQPISDWVGWRDQQLVDVVRLQAAAEKNEPRRS
ncbi:3-hydroxyacyl-CoA dehydrogenase NAD-binding domain-containing protein [Variovorax sp. YR216]|uniref:3-hydroxyacyl-CoA dehydrogenase NAD-binding domain-containing protein n=1 Tax=Variovorax sp. YR216 TaxID=1882828 RepID=UPI00089B72A0|nr:3-hydroxyacyl-CoA dehydrogenase NAD-binding domain-containing protein [Variovorax sp. YR216]SEA86972.1 3-hydroxyacyl-CoA dehydrogenase [Variovorax sp. YR216]